jgi:fructose-bisphosphate aldolase class 1
MTAQALRDTEWKLIAGGKGLLAMDESTLTRDRRFAGVGIPHPEPSGQRVVALWNFTPVSSRSGFELSLRERSDRCRA